MNTFTFLESMYAGSGTRRTRPVIVKLTKAGCFEVISHKPGNPGYPRIRLGKKLETLHRYVYKLKIGPIPQDKLVCHSCDNRMCINPEHLFLGSIGDNNRDMVSKERSYRFSLEDRKKAQKSLPRKLTDAQVRCIREAKGTQESIASLFGVSRSLIGLIRSGQRRTNA